MAEKPPARDLRLRHTPHRARRGRPGVYLGGFELADAALPSTGSKGLVAEFDDTSGNPLTALPVDASISVGLTIGSAGQYLLSGTIFGQMNFLGTDVTALSGGPGFVIAVAP